MFVFCSEFSKNAVVNLWDSKYQSYCDWLINYTMRILDGKARREAADMPHYLHQTWSCWCCTATATDVFEIKKYSAHKPLRTKQDIFFYVVRNESKDICKNIGHTLKTTGQFDTNGYTNISMGSEYDHVIKNYSKQSMTLALRSIKPQQRIDVKRKLNDICPELHLNMKSVTTQMVDGEMTLTQHEKILKFLPYAGIDIFSTAVQKWLFHVSDIISAYMSNQVDCNLSYDFRENAEIVRMACLQAFSKESQLALQEHQQKKRPKTNKFIKHGTFHDFSELARTYDVYGSVRSVRAGHLENTVKLDQNSAKKHNNHSNQLYKMLFAVEIENIQINCAVKGVRYDENGHFKHDGYFTAGAEFLNHKLTHLFSRFVWNTNYANHIQYKDSSNCNNTSSSNSSSNNSNNSINPINQNHHPSIKMFVCEFFNGAGSLKQCQNIFFYTKECTDNESLWKFSHFLICFVCRFSALKMVSYKL